MDRRRHLLFVRGLIEQYELQPRNPESLKPALRIARAFAVLGMQEESAVWYLEACSTAEKWERLVDAYSYARQAVRLAPQLGEAVSAFRRLQRALGFPEHACVIIYWQPPIENW